MDYRKLHWQVDFNGYEYGYPDVDVIGVYTNPETGKDMLIDVENGVVLEEFEVEE